MADVHTLIQRLQAGIPANGGRLVATQVRPGRHREEQVVEVAAVRDHRSAYVAMLLVYAGRPPYYRPWVEIFAQASEVRWPDAPEPFLDSAWERALLAAVAAALGPGGAVYVDCEADAETRLAMNWGIPEPLTRAGALLYDLGFTWFKAWYYPEGFWEGGQKLQAEKPVDAAAAQRHREALAREIRRFLDRATTLPDHPYVRRALERGQRWWRRWEASRNPQASPSTQDA